MNQKDTVIVIDLHGVLFSHDYKKMFSTFFKSENKFKLALALINPSLWSDAIKLIRKGAVAEEFLIGLAEKHQRLKPFVPIGIKIANLQKPNYHFIKLLKHLKKCDYKLYLFSNIGSIIFDDLYRKFPEIFILFESFTIPSKSDGYLRKPSAKAFHRYLKENKLFEKNIILIDDKKRNVKAAKKQGMYAILFHSTAQLQQELKFIGLAHASS